MRSLCLLLSLSFTLVAGEVRVVDVQVTPQDANNFRFDVSLKHSDTGWKHYANRWEVLIDDRIIATRTLHHPHVNEQPFTRSLSNIAIPLHINEVWVRGHDSVHGYGPKEKILISR